MHGSLNMKLAATNASSRPLVLRLVNCAFMLNCKSNVPQAETESVSKLYNYSIIHTIIILLPIYSTSFIAQLAELIISCKLSSPKNLDCT